MKTIHLNSALDAMKNVQEHYQDINDDLHIGREPLTDTVIAGMMEGYSYLNWLLREGINPFEQTNQILEIHYRIFLLQSTEARRENRKFIEATSERFRRKSHEIIDGCESLTDKPFKHASHMFAQGVSQKQLFIEGNHRTHSILANYILLNANKGAFILTRENAVAYFNPSAMIRMRNKETFLDKHIHLKSLAKKMKDFFKEHVNDNFVEKL